VPCCHPVPRDGLTGRLRLVKDDDALNALIASNPDYSVSVLLGRNLLTRSRVDQLKNRLDLAGIIVLPGETEASASIPTPPPNGYSPSTPTPQFIPFIPPSSTIPDEPTKASMFNNTYAWNPLGDGLDSEAFRFAIVQLKPNEEADHMLTLARENEDAAASNGFVRHSAEFRFHMYGDEDSITCLEKTTCIPVGGYSVWGVLGNFTTNTSSSDSVESSFPSSRPIVLATTKLDSTGFFHQLSPGSDDSQASIAVLVAALQALSNTAGVGSLPSQIMFALFDGESFSHVGSRKFVHDLKHFQCAKFNPPGSQPACMDPYKYSVKFQDIQFEQIKKIVEVGQIGLNQTVFLHRQRDGNPATDEIIERIKSTAANMSTPVPTGLAADDTPGIPPACSEAFLDTNSSIAVVVMTDHEGPFANKYWHSEFDSSLNMLTDYIPGSSSAQHTSLCHKATLLARTLWLEAGGDEDGAQNIEASCSIINQLIHCLVEDAACDLVQQYASLAYAFDAPAPGGTVPPHYTSVYQMMPPAYIDSTPYFIYTLFNEYIRNSTGLPPNPNTDPAGRTLFFHDAVDPNLLFDMNANRWRIKSSARDHLLWTESNWSSGIGFRSFSTPNPQTEIIILVAGLVAALVSVLGVLQARKYCAKKFKKL